MNRRFLSVVCTALLLGGSSMLWVKQADQQADQQADLSKQTTSNDAQRSAVEAAPRVAPMRRQAPPSKPFRSSQKKKKAPCLPTLPVKVVLAGTSEAVADASVLVIGGNTVHKVQFAQEDIAWREVTTWNKTGTFHYRTNREGMVSVPYTESTVLFVARKGDLLGQLTPWVHGEEREIYVVELFPIVQVPVKLVNETGKAVAGARVEANLLAHRGSSLGSATTNQLGVASIRIPLCQVQGIADPPTYIQAQGLLQTKTQVPFRLVDIPEEPIVVKIPPTGTVQVSIYDEKGNPFLGSASVMLSLIQSDSAFERNSLSVITSNGAATFDKVGLGQAFRVSASSKHANSVDLVQFQGPFSQGEVVRANLNLVMTDAVVVGTLVDDDFHPLKNFLFEAAYRSGHRTRYPVEPQTITTDEFGRFSLEMPYYSGTLVLTPYGKQAKMGEIQIPIQGQRGAPAGIHNFGALRFTKSASLFGGHIQDHLGNPIHGAKISLFGLTSIRDSLPIHTTLPQLQTRSNHLGAFALKGVFPYEGCMIQVESEGFETAFEEIGIGQKKFKLVLHRKAE